MNIRQEFYNQLVESRSDNPGQEELAVVAIADALYCIADQLTAVHEELSYIKSDTLDDTKEYIKDIGEALDNTREEMRLMDVKSRT